MVLRLTRLVEEVTPRYGSMEFHILRAGVMARSQTPILGVGVRQDAIFQKQRSLAQLTTDNKKAAINVSQTNIKQITQCERYLLGAIGAS